MRSTMRKVVAVVAALLLAALPLPAFAENVATGNVTENPYLVPAAAITAAGIGLTLYGLFHKTGVECDMDVTGNQLNFGCQKTASSGIALAGAAITAGGVTLFMIGKGKKHSVSMVPVQRGLSVQYALKF